MYIRVAQTLHFKSVTGGWGFSSPGMKDEGKSGGEDTIATHSGLKSTYRILKFCRKVEKTVAPPPCIHQLNRSLEVPQKAGRVSHASAPLIHVQ